MKKSGMVGEAQRPLHVIPVKAGDRLAVYGDVHFPVHDDQALTVTYELLKELKPTHNLFNGDTFDAWGLSRHPKEAMRLFESGTLDKESKAGEPWLKLLRSLCDYNVILPGNHEDRWNDLVNAHPALVGLDWTTPYAEALRGWKALPSHSRVVAGPLLIEHGDELLGNGHTASGVLASYPEQNTVFNHVHKFTTASKTTYRNGYPSIHTAHSNAHLSDLSKNNYNKEGPRWDQGSLLIEFYSRGPGVALGYNIHQLRVVRDRKNRAIISFNGITKRY